MEQKKTLIQKIVQESDPKIHDFIKETLADLSTYTTHIPEKITKKILSDVGFNSSDQNTYKLITLMADKLMNETIQSISMIKEKTVLKNNKESEENVGTQNTLPVSKHIKKNKGNGGKSMSLKNLMDELDERGIPVFRANYFPHSNLMSKFAEKLDKN